MRRTFAFAGLLTICSTITFAQAGDFSVSAVSPSINATNVARDADITIDFPKAIDTTDAAQHIRVFASRSGTLPYDLTFENGDTTVRINPTNALQAGDVVTVTIGNGITAADSTLFRSSGFAWQFTAKSGAATLDYVEAQVLDMTGPAPGLSPRPYGGSATDINHDGAVDLMIVNEDVSEVRVCMNQNNGAGTFDDYITPSAPTGSVPSPNHTADFNNDGVVDIATCNIVGDSVSVLLGNDDGTFQTNVNYAVGDNPRGLAVLDADGDGDADLAACNFSDSDVTILYNNGDGTFGNRVDIEGGGNGEYGLDAADMNNDGVFDLVVGARSSSSVIVHLGNGDGTFTAQPAQSAGGAVWMLVCGDVNNDGFCDVTTGNSFSNTGAVMLGAGDGTLGAADTVAVAGLVIATDLGDLDGDGDLDWVLSSFGGQEWTILENDGTGSFTIEDVFPAPSNPACALILDIDNDTDLDLALIEEIDDVIIIMKNPSTPGPAADITGDGAVDTFDLLLLLEQWGTAGLDADIAGNGTTEPDGVVDTLDLLLLLKSWTG